MFKQQKVAMTSLSLFKKMPRKYLTKKGPQFISYPFLITALSSYLFLSSLAVMG
jgi:hypothetical protein